MKAGDGEAAGVEAVPSRKASESVLQTALAIRRAILRRGDLA